MATNKTNSKNNSRSRKQSQASSRNSSNSRNAKGARGAKGTRSQQQPQKRSLKPEPQPEYKESILSARLKNDLIGVLLIAIAAVLLIAVSMSENAIITKYVGLFMHNAFGVGAYILPVFIALFGVCFFFLGRHDLVLSRIAIGMMLIFLAIITFTGVNAPQAVEHHDLLFGPAYITVCGGYVGNGIAWVLLTLVGQPISWVILAAMIVGGLVLIGLSISGLFDWIAEKRQKDDEPEEYVAPYSRARVKSAPAMENAGYTQDLGQAGFVPAAQTVMLDQKDAGKTHVLSRKKDKQAGKAAGVTQVLGGDGAHVSRPGATQVIDPDDEIIQGKGRPSLENGKTRKLDNSLDDVARDFDFADYSDEFGPESDAADVLNGSGLDGAALGSHGASGVVSNAALAAAGLAGAAGMAGEVIGDSDEGGKKSKRRGRGSKASKSADSDKPALLADTKQEQPEEGAFMLPDPKILKKSVAGPRSDSSVDELAEMAARLQETLREFNVDAGVVGWVHGPTVTLFKVSLGSGVRVNKITALSDDIALAFASQSVRIFSPIQGTSLVGIEIPNDTRTNVLLGDVLPPAGSKPLLMAIGKDVEGNAITADLAKMPHLLIGGTTGSGKSVAINSMIMSVLMRSTPDEVRMILIDPKRVELSLYNDIPHLFVPVVTDPHKAASTLAWAVTEMERRLKLFEEVGARNINQYSKMREKHLQMLEEERQRRAEAAQAQAEGAEAEDEDDDFVDDEDDWEKMPSIMIVIDELADLMMVAGKEVETSISRIAQLARAAGIHMIVATQRPSTNVITGLIKANITNRIAFNVASGIDSRVILDTTGAEHLIGNGDMLFSKPEYGKPLRIQGCYVGEDEINEVCSFLKSQGKPDYHEDIFSTSVPILDSGSSSGGFSGGDSDEDLVWQAAEIVVQSNLGSTSALQRRLKVGYARAGRIMDMLEDKGIVGPANGSKPREVYVTDLMELENLKAMDQNGLL